MDPNWNDNQPIYRQLKERVIAMVLEGIVTDGDSLPSVRNVAAEYKLNPLTVLKAYQELVDENLVEKKRGRGMFVKTGASEQLMHNERERFLAEEWPDIQAKVERLGLTPKELLATATTKDASE
ncbi:MAG: GntR family transcriptional regulator [Pseudomonadota bacterium]